MDRDQLDALNALIAQEDESGDYDDLVEMAEGGPVGEDMASEAESGVSYFAQGGEVEDSAAILNRMQQGPTPAPRRTAAQMLQTFADGGEVQKTPFPELLDINKQVSAGAPVENLFGANLSQPTTAMASTPSEINIPTFQPTYTPPTGPNIITPTPAIAGIGAQPTLSQPVSAPTTTARSLFEQINPSTMAAMPDYTTGSSAYTPTAQTFQRPTLLTKEQLQKAQPTLVRYEPSITYGGLETYQGPLQTSPYADTGTPTTGGGTITPTAPEPLPNVTPGGYTYANYVTLTPEQLSGVGDKAQIGEAYKGIVTRQQADATAVRNEYNKALAEGNMPLVEQLKPILAQQESELARSKADQAYVNKYFTGAAAAFETPEQYRQRLQQAQFTALKLPEFTGATDIAALGVPVGPAVDPYTASVTRQTNEYNAALNTYNQLAAAYGKDVDFVKDYFNTIVAPQKADVDALTVGTQATANRAAATAAFNAINAGRAYKVAPAVVADFRNEQQTIAAYAPSIKAFETNIGALTKARDAASNTGFTEYASQLDQLLQTETDKYTQALGQRQSAIDAAQPDPMRDYILGKQLVAQKIDAFAPVDISTVDFSKMNAALFDPEIARQTKDMTAAQNTYNQLSTLYGAKSDVAMNFLNDVLNPQKAEVTQATALKTAAAAAIGSFNAGRAYPKYTRPAITVNKTTTDAAINKTFDPLVATYNKNITTLDLAKSRAQQAGLDQYAEYFDQLIGNEYAKIDQANADREAYIGAIPRAEGSPPEGEVADSRSRALLKKLSGDSDAATVPVQQYGKGGLVRRAEGSPVYGEIAIGEGGITKDTLAGLRSKKGTGSVLSDSARLLRNVMGEGVSNLESAVRGSVAAIPGSVGDIESIFRESDKTRKFATTEEVLRDYMPKRMTKATKEGKGFEEVGSYLPLPIPAGTVSKGVQTVGRAGERLAERNVPRIMERGGKGAKMLEAFSQNTTSNIRKPKGGNWLAGSFEDMFDRLRTPSIAGQLPEDRIPLHQDLLGNPNLSDESRAAAQEYLNRDLANVAIDRWINTKFANYLKNEMGTPEDPVRALAERGILHVDPTNLTYGRHTPFTNQLGQSNAARQWETATDYAINLHSPKEISELAERGSISPNWAGTAKSTLDKNPWLSKLSPDTPVYSEWPGRADAHNLGFDHLLDELRSTVDPSTNLPQHLRWTPKDLEKVTVPQAVQRVAEINDWRAKQAMEAEKAGMMGNLQASPRRVNENFSVSFVDKPGGTWIDVPETVNDKNVNFCTSIGKAGGWCTMEATAAKRYGSGENRLTALLDAEGRPHLQAMITTRPIKTWDDVTETLGATEADKLWQEFTAIENRYVGDKPLDLDDFIKSKGIEAKPTITELKPPENTLQSERVKQYVKRDPEYRRKVTEAAVDFLNSGEWGKVKDLNLFDIIDLNDRHMLQAYVRGMHEDASVANATFNAALDANPNPPRFMTISQLRQFLEGGVPSEGTLRPPVGMSKGGIVKKAAEALTKMGAKESQVAGKELTTLQDTHTSLGDSVRARAAKMQQQMDEMEFKYKPGQRVFTEDSAKKNKAPYTIKSKRLYGDMVVRDPKTLKAVRDPETGKAKRTPYEPGYLIREENGPDDWAEYVLPESAIKGSVDEFAKGGRVGKKLPGKRKYI